MNDFKTGSDVEKTFVLNNRFELHKNFLDYGQPQKFELIENRYLLFERRRNIGPEIVDDGDEIDQAAFISYEHQKLKFLVYRDDVSAEVEVLMKYDGVQTSTCGLRRVHKNGKYGFIDKWDREIIPLEYDWVNDFDAKGISRVTKNGISRCIDQHNEQVTPD
jgi:hypothetical protein